MTADDGPAWAVTVAEHIAHAQADEVLREAAEIAANPTQE